MFHLIPMNGDKINAAHSLAFMGQCLVVAVVVTLFVLGVSGLRI